MAKKKRVTRKQRRPRVTRRNTIVSRREEAVRLLIGMTKHQRELTMRLYERTLSLIAK